MNTASVADRAWPTLLDVLEEGVSVPEIVERLVRRLRADPVLAPALDGVDLARLKADQVRYFTAAFSAVRVHEPLSSVAIRVNGEQFTRVVLHVQDTLVSLRLPETLTEQLMLAVLARSIRPWSPPAAAPAPGAATG